MPRLAGLWIRGLAALPSLPPRLRLSSNGGSKPQSLTSKPLPLNSKHPLQMTMDLTPSARHGANDIWQACALEEASIGLRASSHPILFCTVDHPISQVSGSVVCCVHSRPTAGP